MKPEGRWRVAACVLSTAAVILPFAAVSIPPITDLPQQVAQARLLYQVTESNDSRYLVQWWHPNTLGYLPLLAAWKIASPVAAGRIAMMILGIAWALSIHLAAKSLGRSASNACLASLFFFSHVTYWGLLNFLSGFPVFLWWFVVCERSPVRVTSVRWAARALCALTLLEPVTAPARWRLYRVKPSDDASETSRAFIRS